MSEIRRYLSHIEVAEALGIDREKFYRNKRKLERERGFPTPVRGMGYDPLSIKLWQDAQLAPGAPGLLMKAPAPPAVTPAPAPPPIDLDQEWASVLDRRAEAIAGKALQ